MSTTTNNFGITLPEGSDTFNPLTFNNDAFTLVDSLLRTIKNATVGTANHSLSDNINTITRVDSNTNMFTFIASSDYATSQATYVDGTSVNVRYSDGSSPGNNAYRTNQAVLCYLNGSILTLFTSNVPEKSYVGMIIHSTTLDTADKVKAFYGGNNWIRIKGQFLLGESEVYPINSVGGESQHQLTVDEMPRHNHNLFGSPNEGTYDVNSINSKIVGNRKFRNTGVVDYAGANLPHNNMPPYKAVYIWYRQA